MFLKKKTFMKNDVNISTKTFSSLKWEEPELALKITAGAGAASFLAGNFFNNHRGLFVNFLTEKVTISFDITIKGPKQP